MLFRSSGSSVTITILDDDGAPTVTLSGGGQINTEAGGTATVTATLSALSGRAVTVNLAFTGSATLTDDYTRSGTSIVIAAGSSTGTVTLTSVADATAEAYETIVASIDSVANGTASGDPVTTTIVDDDRTIAGTVIDKDTLETVSGATVTLYADTTADGLFDASDLQVGSASVTGSDGVYSFSGLNGGTYFAVLTAPAGYSVYDSVLDTLTGGGQAEANATNRIKYILSTTSAHTSAEIGRAHV